MTKANTNTTVEKWAHRKGVLKGELTAGERMCVLSIFYFFSLFFIFVVGKINTLCV